MLSLLASSSFKLVSLSLDISFLVMYIITMDHLCDIIRNHFFSTQAIHREKGAMRDDPYIILLLYIILYYISYISPINFHDLREP